MDAVLRALRLTPASPTRARIEIFFPRVHGRYRLVHEAAGGVPALERIRVLRAL
ncbi:hypothetical protein [Amycolatopsis sp. Hca4]|uniref:hypothetical protein n=1 Tax=Amycolatopsis sp. Hca4 TaxID=2742131 RepID=UPI00159239E8|nr:hypothetical protein [Amycolatopsis sp. Hca4]QKV73638.1 hypothetical protein HUT10_07500 [Amycolatopsis sp. Hca4]